MSNKYEQIKEKFILFLEEKAISLREDIIKIDDELETYKYMENLQEVIYASILSFCDCLVTSKEEKKEEFINKLKVILKESEIENILKEASNLSTMNKEGLIKKNNIPKEARKSIEVINNLYDEVCTYLSKTDIKKDKKEKLSKEKEFEKIENIGTNLDESVERNPIDDMDYFEKLVEEFDCNEVDKVILVEKTAVRNLDLYNKIMTKQNKKVKKLIEEYELEKIKSPIKESSSKKR